MLDISNLLKEFSKLKNKKIITVTLNPVIDRTLWVKNFTVGKTIKTDRVNVLAAGKGVNVSRALKILGISSIATGILPNDGSDYYLSLLKRESINSDFFIAKIREPVRTNITILSNTTKNETHLREKGPNLNIDIFNQFKIKLKKLAQGADSVILSGSIPLGLPDESYKELIDIINPVCKISALDSSGLSLKHGIRALPRLIKPNEVECKEVLGYLPQDKKSIIRAIGDFYKIGIEHILLSVGEKGLIYSNGKSTVKAFIKLSKIVNSVGSGDATLAGGVATILAGFSEDQIAAFSCAMGAANALSYGACIIDLNDLNKAYKNIDLEKL